MKVTSSFKDVVLLCVTVFENVAAPAKVETPAMLTLSKFVCPSTSKSASTSTAPVNVDKPVALKFLVTISGPIEAPPITLIPLTKRLEPSKRRLLLSSSSPPVPANTTLPEVKSSTLNVLA